MELSIMNLCPILCLDTPAERKSSANERTAIIPTAALRAAGILRNRSASLQAFRIFFVGSSQRAVFYFGCCSGIGHLKDRRLADHRPSSVSQSLFLRDSVMPTLLQFPKPVFIGLFNTYAILFAYFFHYGWEPLLRQKGCADVAVDSLCTSLTPFEFDEQFSMKRISLIMSKPGSH